MGLLAIIILAHTQSLEQLEPQIIWFFHASSCAPCVNQQLDTMIRYHRQDDRLVIYTANPKADARIVRRLKDTIHLRFPESTVETTDKKIRLGVGWVFQDHIPGERVIYQTTKGIYNSWRSESLLAVLREGLVSS